MQKRARGIEHGNTAAAGPAGARAAPQTPRPLEASQTWSSLQALFAGLNSVETVIPFC